MPDALSRSALRWRALRYTITYIVPCGAWATFTDRNPTPWMVPLFAFGLIPLLDLILRGRHTNLSEAEERVVLEDPTFDVLLYLFVPIQYVLLFLFLHRMQEGGLQSLDLAGHIATMGILCGVYGINVAHELGHRTKRWERDLARALLLSSLYMHFIIEHNRGHHRRVATPDDPASARYGETVYGSGCAASCTVGFRHGTSKRNGLRKIGQEAPLRMQNEMLHTACMAVRVLCWSDRYRGRFGIPALVGLPGRRVHRHPAAGNGELHRALRAARVRTAGEGTYGECNTSTVGTAITCRAYALFELTRHSDHHWKASKKYQVLQSLEEAPQLPTGYPGMMLLSLVPPLFFAVVHPRIAATWSFGQRDLILAR
jgi:alkane 1-monooxygenase